MEQAIRGPQRLAIYYGWPSLVAGARGDAARAAEHFAAFDLVVLGDGLEHPEHGDHAATLRIVGELRARDVHVFGYVDMGVTTQNLDLRTARAYVREWEAMGVSGVFWDDAGADFGVDRARLSSLIGFTHDRGLVAFVNAWSPDDVLGGRTPLGPGDVYLAESHPVAGGRLGRLEGWWQKSRSLEQYREALGVRIAAVSTGPHAPGSAAFAQALWAARMFDWDAFGFTDARYGASGEDANGLPPLPAPVDAGTVFTGAPARRDSDSWVRLTDRGRIEVWGGDGHGGGAFRSHPGRSA